MRPGVRPGPGVPADRDVHHPQRRGEQRLPLPDGLPTLAQCFNDAGYRTGYIGKWHLAGPTATPRRRVPLPVKEHARGGYRDWLAVEALEFSDHEYRTVLYDNDNEPVELPGYRVDACADAGIRYIHEHRDEPFF